MFGKTARFYDRLYSATGKDYVAEARAVAALIRAHAPNARKLLDVGCGTGAHLEEFAKHGFACRGIDADPEMVAFARSRLPDLEIEPGDMRTFSLGERFDAIVCLFGTIAYARTGENLDATVANLAAHLAQGGVVVAEGWLSRTNYTPGRQDLKCVDDPELKVARLSLARQVGSIAIVDFHYLVGTPAGGIERHFNRHELGLFEDDEYRAAFTAAGLTVEAASVPEIAFGRPLYVGVKP